MEYENLGIRNFGFEIMGLETSSRIFCIEQPKYLLAINLPILWSIYFVVYSNHTNI